MKAPENIKFWTTLAIVALMVAIAVTLIDLSIKAAILEESNTLRRIILNGRGEKGSTDSGASDDGSSASVLLDLDSTRMEAGNVHQQSNGKVPPNTSRNTRSKSRAQGNPPEVPSGD
jgi:hypothetical protein